MRASSAVRSMIGSAGACPELSHSQQRSTSVPQARTAVTDSQSGKPSSSSSLVATRILCSLSTVSSFSDHERSPCGAGGGLGEGRQTGGDTGRAAGGEGDRGGGGA